MTAPSDAQLRQILKRTKTVAIVGVSRSQTRASNFVARYLHMRGHRVIPVNPAYDGAELFGEPFLPSIAEIPEGTPVDMVDIFRGADHVLGIVDESLTHLLPALSTIWMQFGIVHEEAAAKARTAGLDVVMDRCPKVETQRLFGELRKAGFNTGIISSKLPLDW